MSDPSRSVIPYDRAAQILGITNGAVRALVHRGTLTAQPTSSRRHAFLLEIDVLRLEQKRRGSGKK